MNAAHSHQVSGYSDILISAITSLLGEIPASSLSSLLQAMEIQYLRAGEALYRQGEPGDSMHILVSGRLQVEVAYADGAKTIVAFPKPGDVVGEMAVFSGEPRAATIVALRDSALGIIRRSAFDEIASCHPQAFFNVSRVIISRLRGARDRVARRSGATIVVLTALHETTDISEFSTRLRLAFLRLGSVLILDGIGARKRLLESRFDDYGRLLDEMEGNYRFIVLIADRHPSPWTGICRGYADRVLLVADSNASRDITEQERWFFSADNVELHAARMDLVLVHQAGKSPQSTRAWLSARPKVTMHHHVCLSRNEDFERIARIIAGCSISLVLAGGGARGFAHLGVIRALHESGVSIDAIGGTSFGALAATGLARGLGDTAAQEELRLAFSRRDPLGDYTIPVMSLVRGEYLNRILRDHLPMDIEDLWLPYFSVSSNLSTNGVRVHESGPLWKAIRASVSLPAILPPVLDAGDVLIDGGVLNNLPVDVMRERMDGPILAVDLTIQPQGKKAAVQIPSALDFIKSRLLPGRTSLDAPTVSRVILQVTTLASRKEVQSARKLADLYLNPPVERFDLLDWDRMREIADTGYEYALPQIQKWLSVNPGHWQRDLFLRSWVSSRKQNSDQP